MKKSDHPVILNALAFAFIVSIFCSLFMIIYYAPVDETLGLSQKIFYVHLGSASAMGLSVLIAFFASIAYLVRSNGKADVLASSAAETAVVFGAIVLSTGMIWAKTAWGTFLPLGEIKLIMFLLLWIIFIVYLLIRRSFPTGRKQALASAVFAIIGSAVMPFVVLAARWFDSAAQLHPNVIKSDNAALPREMLLTLLVTIASWLLASILLTTLAAKLRQIEREIKFTFE